MKTLGFIFALISEAWGLIFKGALVILAIVIVVGFIKSCTANATLSEHSSCQQFAQADTTAQNHALEDMMVAHHNAESILVTRFSVTLYCNVHDENSPIDGIYNSSNVGQPSGRVLHLSTPF